MTTALSIDAAASECSERVALIADGRSYTYAEMAILTKSVGVPSRGLHRASSTLETVLLLYHSLQSRRPLALVSKSASDSELNEIGLRLANAHLENTALILFTSGSSGESKGVCISQEALVASASAAAKTLGWAEDDRWLCCLPLSHIGGLSILLRCLAARKTAVLCEGFAPETVAQALSTYQITQVSLVPTMLWRLLEHGTRAPSRLRTTLIGGAPLTPDLARRAAAGGFRLRPSYGMTETASMVVCDGHPLPGVRIRIEDDARLSIFGPMLMQGYLPPDDTHSPFRDGWLQTSDRARIDEQGHLEILGRSDDMIISGGENISLEEVEATLSRHPRIQACLALGIPDAEWGHKLVALVVCQGDAASISCDALSGHKHPKLLISVDDIPLLESGKPDRKRALSVALAQQT